MEETGGTYDHDVERNHHVSFCPIRFCISCDIVHKETRSEKEGHFEEIYYDGQRRALLTTPFRFHIPNKSVIGLLVHHPSSTRKGIQKSVNWILRSIAFAFAKVAGGGGVPKNTRSKYRTKKIMATAPSAEYETSGRRTRPNHLQCGEIHEMMDMNKQIIVLLFDTLFFSDELNAIDQLYGPSLAACVDPHS